MIPRWVNRYLPEDEKTRARLFTVVGSVAGFLAGTIFSPFFSFTISGTLMSIQERATLPMLVERSEVVRRAIAEVPCDGRILAYAPVIQQAVEWNVRVAHEQEANRHWYSDYFSSDGWDRVAGIPLPCAGDWE